MVDFSEITESDLTDPSLISAIKVSLQNYICERDKINLEIRKCRRMLKRIEEVNS